MAEMDTGSSGGTGGGDGGASLSERALSAITSLSDSLDELTPETKSLLQDPRTFILVVAYEAIVGGLLEAAASVIGLVLEAGTLAASVFPMSAGALMNALGAATGALGGLLEAFFGALVPMVEVLGPFGPLLAIIVAYSIAKAAGPALEVLLGLISPRLLAIWKVATPFIPYVGGR